MEFKLLLVQILRIINTSAEVESELNAVGLAGWTLVGFVRTGGFLIFAFTRSV